MKRREAIKNMFLLASAACCTPQELFAKIEKPTLRKFFATENIVTPKEIGALKIYLQKMAEPDKTHESDIFVEKGEMTLFLGLLENLKKAEKYLGFGNFTASSFDEAIFASKMSNNYIEYAESLFLRSASDYGFYGDKPIEKIWHTMDKTKFTRINGLFLSNIEASNKYKAIVSSIGSSIYITSGVRNVSKQLLLFMDKAKECNFNLSMASRTLAPPGYSYHGVGDFDIGKKGLGELNFTEKFADTEEFKKAVDQGFIALRYEQDNLLGVRFEPWHIKV